MFKRNKEKWAQKLPVFISQWQKKESENWTNTIAV